MLHYELEKKKGSSLYEELYQKLKEDILRGRILPGTKLPSKRELARDNGISVKTVLSAYEQLVVEGYLYSKEKKGYFRRERKVNRRFIVYQSFLCCKFCNRQEYEWIDKLERCRRKYTEKFGGK